MRLAIRLDYPPSLPKGPCLRTCCGQTFHETVIMLCVPSCSDISSASEIRLQSCTRTSSLFKGCARSWGFQPATKLPLGEDAEGKFDRSRRTGVIGHFWGVPGRDDGYAFFCPRKGRMMRSVGAMRVSDTWNRADSNFDNHRNVRVGQCLIVTRSR